jgi:hypothetical protein
MQPKFVAIFMELNIYICAISDQKITKIVEIRCRSYISGDRDVYLGSWSRYRLFCSVNIIDGAKSLQSYGSYCKVRLKKSIPIKKSMGLYFLTNFTILLLLTGFLVPVQKKMY